MDDLTPDPDALARMQEQDQAAASLRSLAEAAVVARGVLVSGGVSDAVADQMVLRFWLHMFPGSPGALGFLIGGGGPPS